MEISFLGLLMKLRNSNALLLFVGSSLNLLVRFSSCLLPSHEPGIQFERIEIQQHCFFLPCQRENPGIPDSNGRTLRSTLFTRTEFAAVSLRPVDSALICPRTVRICERNDI